MAFWKDRSGNYHGKQHRPEASHLHASLPALIIAEAGAGSGYSQGHHQHPARSRRRTG